MKCYAFVNEGLADLARREIQEITGTQKTSTSATSAAVLIHNSVLEFEVQQKEDLLALVYKTQAIRKVLVAISAVAIDNPVKSTISTAFYFDNADFLWKDFFPANFTYTIDVENVQGLEDRLAISKKMSNALVPSLQEKHHLTAVFDYKNPDFFFVCRKERDTFFVGLDLCGGDRAERHYRVFPHSGSFKGDLGYFFIRSTGYKEGEKIMVGFTKDGVLPIEAALFSQKVPVLDTKKIFSFHKFPLYLTFNFDNFLGRMFSLSKKEINIFGFDSSMPNVIAARKNAKIAGVSADIQRCALDELDVKFKRGEFDRVLFHVTKKDEDKLNEMYYQALYVLKKGGTLAFISRSQWDISFSDKWELEQKKEICRGNSCHMLLVLKKK